MWFAKTVKSQEPPAYDESQKGTDIFPNPKVAEWKEKLERHKHRDVDFLVDQMIDRIDENVDEFGIFPRGFMILDCAIDLMHKTIWKKDYQVLQNGWIRDVTHYKILCLQDESLKEARKFITKIKLDDKLRQLLKTNLEDKTGLSVTVSQITKGVRVEKDDPTKETTVLEMTVDIKLP